MAAGLATRAILVRRYARSRLYDVVNRRYVSLEQLRAWVAQGIAVSVVDAETGDNVTRVLLA